MVISPAVPRKHHFPAVSCEQPVPQDSHGMRTCYANTPLSPAARRSVQNLHLSHVAMTWKKFSLTRIYLEKKKRKTLIGQYLFILRGILNLWKTPSSNTNISNTTETHT